MSAEEEKTPESVQKAIEDGAVVEGKIGDPRALGPQGSVEVPTNPFWSSFARDEATLKALRPSSLPAEPVGTSEMARLTTPKDQMPGELQQALMLRSVLEENARLWNEMEKMKAMLLGGVPSGSASNSGLGMNLMGQATSSSGMLSWLGKPSTGSGSGLLGSLMDQAPGNGAKTNLLSKFQAAEAPAVLAQRAAELEGRGMQDTTMQGGIRHGDGARPQADGIGNAGNREGPPQGGDEPTPGGPAGSGGQHGGGLPGGGAPGGGPPVWPGGNPWLSSGDGHADPGGFSFGGTASNLPAWYGGLLGREETVRSLELPPLPELSESEVGPLIAGDWITSVTPFMKDLSSSSAAWWDEVLRCAGDLYGRWLSSEPMERLRIRAVTPESFKNMPWARIEQRGQVVLLRALPESLRQELVAQREMGSIQIVFKILRVYQPGGLAERTTLLRQLVEQRVPANVGEWIGALRSWRRWLVRIDELKIQPPDPVLLLATLDRYASALARASPQVAFRLQMVRAALKVDVAPTSFGIQQFAEALMAEGEAVMHGGSTIPLKESTKVRSLEATEIKNAEYKQYTGDGKSGRESRDGKGDGKGGKGDGKNKSTPVCKFFLTEYGCKKGNQCGFVHEWGSVNKHGRCWTCGSTKHLRPECPVRETPKVKKADKKELVEEKGEREQAVPNDAASSSGQVEVEKDRQGIEAALLKEAVHLMKSLRPSLKAMTMVASVQTDCGRALLDGGATHILRQARNVEEYQKAVPIVVELASGTATLRQVLETGTLLDDKPTQTIIPLGKIAALGFRILWEGDMFELRDCQGKVIDVELISGCPTVERSVAEKLIDMLEGHELELDTRLRSLRAGEVGEVPLTVWRWMEHFRRLFPEVPDDLVVRTVPTGVWAGEELPWNRRQRRRHAEAESIVLHLFSGKDQAWWSRHLDEGRRVTVCVDTVADPRQDLKSDAVMSYLMELAEKGVIHAVVGGPPCRTMSKLRFQQPGPPSLRSRDGPGRFGLEDLTEWQQEQVKGDTILWLRQLWLFVTAKESTVRPVCFLKEHPQDPQDYKGKNDETEYPSYFSWPEWRQFCRIYGVQEVKFDMGVLGHPRCKPTTVGTNMRGLLPLHERRT